MKKSLIRFAMVAALAALAYPAAAANGQAPPGAYAATSNAKATPVKEINNQQPAFGLASPAPEGKVFALAPKGMGTLTSLVTPVVERQIQGITKMKPGAQAKSAGAVHGEPPGTNSA